MRLPEFVVREDGTSVTRDGAAVVEPWNTQCLRDRGVRTYEAGLADFNRKLESRYGVRVVRSVWVKAIHGLYSVSYLDRSIGVGANPRTVHMNRDIGAWVLDGPAMEAKVHL